VALAGLEPFDLGVVVVDVAAGEDLPEHLQVQQAQGVGGAGEPDRVGEYQWAVAECDQELSDWKKAIGVYRQCDNYPEVYYRMAHCHRKLKQYKEALLLYNQAKGHDGHAPRATLDIGFTYEQAGEKEKAIKTFQATCRSWPKSGQASRAHAHLQNK